MSRKSNVSNGDFCQKTLPSKRKPHPETAWKKIGADLWVHQGPPFASDQLYKFSHEYDFKHTFTSPYCQQANGEAESVVRIAKILKQSDPFFHLCPTELHPTHPQV